MQASLGCEAVVVWSELSLVSSQKAGAFLMVHLFAHHPEQICRHSPGSWGQPETLDHRHRKHEGRRYNPEL